MCISPRGVKVALKLGVKLVKSHGAVIEFHKSDYNNKYKGKERIEVIGNGLYEKGKSLAVGRILGNGGGPRRNGRNHTNWGGGSVDDIGQL